MPMALWVGAFVCLFDLRGSATAARAICIKRLTYLIVAINLRTSTIIITLIFPQRRKFRDAGYSISGGVRRENASEFAEARA
jgi:hypothetical protein